MSTPLELVQQGQLTQAIEAATDAVRNQPSDVGARSLLCELLCFEGEFERADKQLEAASQIDADSMVGVSLIRHLIRSELCRKEVFEEGRLPEFLTQPTTAQQLRLKAVAALREGAHAEATGLAAQASEEETDVSGSLNNEDFDGFRDLDDILGPMVEIFTATGQYYWLSADQIVSLEFSGISHISDMLWRAAEIMTVGDVSGRVHVPALYYGSCQDDDERLRIGRATDWKQHGEDGPITGVGQREWLAGDDAVPVNQVGFLSFSPGEES